MGFINYHGAKENNFNDVLEYAHMQQEEEHRRNEDEYVDEFISELVGDKRYSGLTIDNVLKCLLSYLKKMELLRKKICQTVELDRDIDDKVLWNDFYMYTISSHLVKFDLDINKKNKYFDTYINKIFKLSNCISAEMYYGLLVENKKYKSYFDDCFSMVYEKQFWKYIGTSSNLNEIVEFTEVYKNITILLGLYLYQGLRPADRKWMNLLMVEKQVMDKIKSEYKLKRLKSPNYIKLRNPLYVQPVSEVNVDEAIETASEEESKDVSKVSFINTLDKEKLEKLLTDENIESYIEASKLLVGCNLPDNISKLYVAIGDRLKVLEETLEKYKDMYEPDMYMFNDYYVPESFRITSSFLEYLEVGIGEQILNETRQSVIDATEKLLQAINDLIDEIYQFASIEINAQAKALATLMEQDGYVNLEHKIN